MSSALARLAHLGSRAVRGVITGRFDASPRTWDQARADALVQALEDAKA